MQQQKIALHKHARDADKMRKTYSLFKCKFFWRKTEMMINKYLACQIISYAVACQKSLLLRSVIVLGKLFATVTYIRRLFCLLPILTKMSLPKSSQKVHTLIITEFDVPPASLN